MKTKKTVYIMDAESGRFYEEGRKNPFTHCLVYKKCGKDGVGDWQRTFPMTKEEAIESCEGMKKILPFGEIMVVNYKQSVNIGLPDYGT